MDWNLLTTKVNARSPFEMQMKFISFYIPMHESPLQATIVDNLNEKL